MKKEKIRGADCKKCGTPRYYSSRVTLNQAKSDLCVSCCQKKPNLKRRLRPFEAQYNAAKSKARYDWDISYNDWLTLVDNKECHYCDTPIHWNEWTGQGGSRTIASNLDRINIDKGYDLDNVVVSCQRCNYARGTHFSYEEWRKIGETIKTFDDREFKVTPQVRKLKKRAKQESIK